MDKPEDLLRDNSKRFLHLRLEAGITQSEAAQFIADYTKRPCALRTVQSWETPWDKSSARTCPDWAVAALEAKLKRKRLIPT
jgi:hypothetical protein